MIPGGTQMVSKKLHGMDEMNEKRCMNFVHNGGTVDAAGAFGYNRIE